MESTNGDALRHSYELVDQRSCLLDASYIGLQDQVDALTRELKLSKLARHREYVERERLSNRMSGALDALPGAVIVLDGGGIVREKNSKAIQLLNQPLAGCAWSEIARREFCTDDATDGDLRLHDGRWFNLSRQPLGTATGEILLLTDVSESRRTADLIQRRERLSAIGEMTATLAHQIRTPLTSALLYIGQFGSGLQDEKILAAKISARLNELVRMVDDMLIYAGGARRSGESFRVSKVFRDILESIDPNKDSKALNIVALPTELTIAGNRDSIRGALSNLIDNARQACGDAARIEMGAELVNGRVCLTVSDNGHGISADIKDQLFKPFFTTRPQGTGLGLAVVRAVAEAHDGEVLVDSSAHGSTFALCLPGDGEN